jgi:hypothetical protein
MVTITLNDVANGLSNTTDVTVLQPTVDSVQIRDAPGGGGMDLTDPGNYPDYVLGYSTTFYGAYFNDTAGYLGDVPGTSTWSSNDTNIVTVTTPGDQSTITCDNANWGWVWVELDDGVYPAVQTQVTVLQVVIDYIQIRSAAGGGGIDLGDPANYPSYPVGHITTLYAAFYNNTSGYIGGLSVDWDSDGPSIVSVAPSGSSTTVTCSNTISGTVTITADDTQGNTNTTQVTVIPPTPDYVLIRDASGGGGTDLSDSANYPTYWVGYSTTFYGAEYNDTAGYLGDVDGTSTWDSDDPTIVTVATPGFWSTVTCNNTNWGTVTITLDDPTTLLSTTTDVTVMEPTVDYILIRDAAGGAGTNLSDSANYPDYPVGHTTTFYGAEYNDTAGFIGDVPLFSTWNSNNPAIVGVASPGSSSAVTCSDTAFGLVTITLDDSVHQATTQVNVTSPTTDYILIRDASGGGGTDISDPANYPSYPVGGTAQLYGAAYNDTADYIGDVPTTSTWNSATPSIVTVTSPASVTNMAASTTNSGSSVITLDDGLGHQATTTVTVDPPTIDYVWIMDEAGGTGSWVGDMIYGISETDMFYLAGFNNTAGYVNDVDASYWSVEPTSGVGEVSPATSSSTTTFTALDVDSDSTCKVTAVYGSLTNMTGVLTVLGPKVDYIQIRDAAGGVGNIVMIEPTLLDKPTHSTLQHTTNLRVI